MSASIEMFVCSKCFENVPKMNEVVHNIRCKGNRKPVVNQGSSQVDESFASAPVENSVRVPLPVSSSQTISAATPERTVSSVNGLETRTNELNSSNTYNTNNGIQDQNSNSWPCNTCTLINTVNLNRCMVCDTLRTVLPSSITNNNNHNNNNININNSSSTSCEMETAASNNTTNNWICRSCTLSNDNLADHCAVCGTSPPNPSDNNSNSSSSSSSTTSRRSNNNNNSNRPMTTSFKAERDLSNLHTATMIGAVTGGVLSLMQADRSITNGVTVGAGIGALGGILYNIFYPVDGDDSSNSSSSNSSSRSRSSSSTGTRAPRVQVVRMNGGRTTTFTIGSGGITTSSSSSSSSASGSGINSESSTPVDIERMIERMLGDLQLHGGSSGSDTHNNGLTAEAIQQINTQIVTESSIVSNPTCYICLDDFQIGTTIKSLPCLHKFHCQCIDRWLRQANSCPMCKYCLTNSS